ncbi:hypothetical protein ABW19_dt0208512 [Dactylella cylindrospora]|nr:hypothetical protein ABW19_dt0208512 [Dactylella cylindrospora]
MEQEPIPDQPPPGAVDITSFDEGMAYVHINPRALAWELLHLNDIRDPSDPDRVNPWHVLEGEEPDGRYKREYVKVNRNILPVLARISVYEVPGFFARLQIEKRDNDDDVSAFREQNHLFEETRRQSEMLNRQIHHENEYPTKVTRSHNFNTTENSVQAPKYGMGGQYQDNSGSERKISANTESPYTRKKPLNEDDYEDYLSDDGQAAGGSEKTAKPSKKEQDHKKEEELKALFEKCNERVNRDSRIALYNIQARRPEKPLDPDPHKIANSFTLMKEVVSRQMDPKYMGNPDYTMSKIKAFHLERLRCQALDKTNPREEDRPFNTSSARLFIPLRNNDPKTNRRLFESQNEKLFTIDVMRVHWKNLDQIAYIRDPEYRRVVHEYKGKPPHELLEGIKKKIVPNYHYFNMTKHHRQVVSYTVGLITKDALAPIERDIQELIEYAVIQYFTGTEQDNLKFRQALLVMWEAIMNGMMRTRQKIGQYKTCSCDGRFRLASTMEKYKIPKEYFKFFATSCIGCFRLIERVLASPMFEGRNWRDIPDPLDDIHVEDVLYGGQQRYLPHWMVRRHMIVFTLVTHLRRCYQSLEGVCHGTDRDHVELIMRVVWGPKSLEDKSPDRGMYRSIYGAIRLALVDELEKFSDRFDDLGCILARYDMELTKQRFLKRKEAGLVFDQELGIKGREPRNEGLRKLALIARNSGNGSNFGNTADEEGSRDAGFVSHKAQKVLGVGVPLDMRKEKKREKKKAKKARQREAKAVKQDTSSTGLTRPPKLTALDDSGSDRENSLEELELGQSGKIDNTPRTPSPIWKTSRKLIGTPGKDQAE